MTETQDPKTQPLLRSAKSSPNQPVESGERIKKDFDYLPILDPDGKEIPLMMMVRNSATGSLEYMEQNAKGKRIRLSLPLFADTGETDHWDGQFIYGRTFGGTYRVRVDKFDPVKKVFYGDAPEKLTMGLRDLEPEENFIDNIVRKYPPRRNKTD